MNSIDFSTLCSISEKCEACGWISDIDGSKIEKYAFHDGTIFSMCDECINIYKKRCSLPIIGPLTQSEIVIIKVLRL